MILKGGLNIYSLDKVCVKHNKVFSNFLTFYAKIREIKKFDSYQNRSKCT